MGAYHSEFKEIEDNIRKVLQDRDAVQGQLECREREYQENIQQLSSRLEWQEKRLKQLTKDKEEMEAAPQRASANIAILRNEVERNVLDLRQQIKLFHNIETGIESREIYHVGIFGNTGVGKTSLLNSMKFAVQGYLKDSMKEQVSPKGFHGGHTIRRLFVKITPTLTFIDNRGIGPADLEFHGVQELMRQLEGRASVAKPVNWSSSNQQSSQQANISKRILCSILVIHAQLLNSIGPHGKRFLQCMLRFQGCYPVAVITHVDVASPQEVRAMHDAIKSTGITDVYEVANVTDERKVLDTEYQISLLRLLQRCTSKCQYTQEYHSKLEKKENK